MSVSVLPTLAVLDRGGLIVATVKDLAGGVFSIGGQLTGSFTGTVVGTTSYWCEPGVDVRLTFLTRPRRKNSERLSTEVTITSFADSRITLVGTDVLHCTDTYAGPIPPIGVTIA